MKYIYGVLTGEEMGSTYEGGVARKERHLIILFDEGKADAFAREVEQQEGVWEEGVTTWNDGPTRWWFREFREVVRVKAKALGEKAFTALREGNEERLIEVFLQQGERLRTYYAKCPTLKWGK